MGVSKNLLFFLLRSIELRLFDMDTMYATTATTRNEFFYVFSLRFQCFYQLQILIGKVNQTNIQKQKESLFNHQLYSILNRSTQGKNNNNKKERKKQKEEEEKKKRKKKKKRRAFVIIIKIYNMMFSRQFCFIGMFVINTEV